MNLRIGKFKNSRNGTPMKTRTALSVALSALMVFSTIPTGAIKAIADEVTPQVEVIDTPDATDVVNDEGAATDVVGEGESSDQQDAVTDDEQQAYTEDPASGDEEATAEEEPSDEEDAAEEKDDADKVLLAAAADGDGGPLRAVPVPGFRETVDTKALGITLNMFDYEAQDWAAWENRGNRYNADDTNNFDTSKPTHTGINYGKDYTNQLKFYATGDGVETPCSNAINGSNPGNTINQFTGVALGSVGHNPQPSDSFQGARNFYTLQYANQGIVKRSLVEGYPVLNTDTQDPSTKYLFDPDTRPSDSNARTDYLDVNNLFYVKNKGLNSEYLVYDSNESYAFFDTNTGSNPDKNFKVYQGTYDRHGGSKSGLKVGFFPFNDWYKGSNNDGPEINPNSGTTEVNHHLGLTMSVPLTMPYDGVIQTADGREAPMIFEFSGDDDMWVFVDGKLVLDIGGIHQPVGGIINFQTGVVQLRNGTEKDPVYFLDSDSGQNNPHYVTQAKHSYPAAGIVDENVVGDTAYLWDVYGFNGDGTPILTPTYDGQAPDISGILGDKNSPENRGGSSHTLQCFYLERGGCDSNLMISTNIHLMTKVKASVQKEWEGPSKNEARMCLARKESPRNSSKSPVFVTLPDWARALDASCNWAAEWNDLPREGYGQYYKDDYCDFEYYVFEEPLPGFEPLFSNADAGTGHSLATEGAVYYIKDGPAPSDPVNKLMYPVNPDHSLVGVRNIPTYLEVTKEWKNAEGTGADTESHDNDSVWVQLYKQTLTSEEPEVWSEETPVGDPVELKESSEKPWTHRYEIEDTGDNVRYYVKEGTKVGDTFTPLPTNGVIMAAKANDTDTGRPYVWHSTTYKNKTLVVGEGGSISWNESDPKKVTPQTPADSPDQYVTVPHHGSASATIANKPVVTRITVKKVWTDGAAQHPSVWVQLYKDGAKVGTPVEVTDGVARVFEGLVPTGVYTVKEGTYDNETFTPQESFDLTTTDGKTMVYVQDSVTYKNPDESERDASYLDGKVYPDAGSVVITNKPLQADISLKKVDADSEGGTATIPGVKFKLLKDKGEAGVYEPTIDTDVVENNITTGPDGTASLPKLDPGTYWLLETEAADGYLMRDPNHPIGIKFTDADGGTLDLIFDPYDTDKTRPVLTGPDVSGVYTLTVKDLRAYSLPSAGGPGVYPFLLVGSFAAAYAARDALDKRKSPSRSQSRRGRPGDF